MLGQPLTRFKLPDVVEKDMDTFKNILQGKDVFSYDAIYKTKSGELKYLIFRARLVRDEERTVIGIQGMAHDITDRQKVESLLRKSEQQLQSLIQNIQAAVVVHDSDTRVIASNAKAQDLLGLTEGQMLGKTAIDPYWKLVNYDHTVLSHKEFPINKVLTSHQPVLDIILGIQRPDKNKLIWVLVNAVPVLNNSKEISQVIVTFTDITELKTTEESLKNAQAELEIKVEERTADYKKAKDEAERANKLKSEFLSNMSHELRTPMHAILSYSRFGIDKLNKISEEKKLNYFKRIKTAGDGLMNLLNDLLDLSKLEAGKEVYKMNSVNIWQKAKEIVSEMDTIWKEKNLKIKVEDPLAPIKIVCDEGKVDQVIRNLLSNAMKFTPEDKHITVSLSSGELQYGKRSSDNEVILALTVSVKDQGVGIPDDELDSIFDKFIQSSKTKNGAGGTGLGLAICKEIINAHSGKIWTENNPEGGATFSFMLPYEQNTE
jgi:PAS domain S-box-containing protein